MKRFILAAALTTLATTVQAAETRYSTWSDPNQPQVESSSKMVEELRALVTEAEKARAADPKFLQDLKDLAARYDGSVQSLIFRDEFLDGDYTNNPTWQVTSGKYWVESGYGLRSFVEAVSTTQTSEQRKLSKEEKIIGGIVGLLGGQVQIQQPQQQASATTVTPATIYTAQKINNAFILKINVSSWAAKGHFEVGPYQGSKLNTGYKLVYSAGESPALQLLRNYTSSSSVIASVASLKLEDQKYHDLEWVRNKAGQMTVSVDGKVLIQTSDNGFRDDFAGLMMKNAGGDYIIKSVSVSGAR
ncbi:MAG: hypothetical protein HWE30_08615 [Methylocystaceae bacterium]|nr:hypothetical protein [Methylocystaceae bacterium]